MAVKIRLARAGRKKHPFYRIVAADSRMPRDGRFIEILGYYNPMVDRETQKEAYLKVDVDLINKWIKNGAQMTDRVRWFVTKGYINLNAPHCPPADQALASE